jgi:HK97 family phage major capsid protein
MAYNNIVSRTDASSLIPEEVVRDMTKRATDDSAVLRMFRRVPVGRNQVRFPVLSALPVAYWVTGDTGLKQTTEINWANKYLNIEEMATIMPVPDSVVADMEANIWDESMPYLVEAFGRLLDSSVFFGTSAPASFPTNVSAAALAAGNTVTESLAATAGGFYGDFDAALALLEADGFDASGVVAARSARGKFRAARDADGNRLDLGRTNAGLTEVDGLPISYPMRGLFPAGTRLFIGDWTQFVVGIRQDITMDIFREGVIQDNTGAIVFNLMQQDMTAIRLTFRVGWQVSNLINYDQPVEGSRYPAVRLMY